MTGLMMKDALVMRKTLRLYALFLLFYSGLAVLGVFPMSMALAMVEVIVMVLPISSFSYDEAAKWDRYAAVLPVGRTAVVKARYLFLLLVLLAVVWSGYALWDNSRVYAAADNVQAGLLAFKPQPQEDNSLSFGQLRDINPDVCGWLTLDGTAIDYPVVQGESNFTYLNTDVYGSFALAGSIFLDVDCDADFSGRYSLLYGHHMENGRMFGDLDKYKDGAFFRQNTTGTLTLPGGSYRLEVLACLVVPASEQAIFAPGKWRSDAGGLLPFVEENALQMDAQALRALEKEPEGAQFLAMATCSGEYTDARTVVLARMEPMSDLQNGKEESLS